MKNIFIILSLIIVSILTYSMYIVVMPATSLEAHAVDVKQHVVSPNETMWGIISKEYSSLINKGEDIREIIFLVEEYNKTSARLEVGQVVLLPTIQ